MPKRKRTDLIAISTRITEDQKKAIGEIARGSDLTEAQLIRRFIERGIEEHQARERDKPE